LKRNSRLSFMAQLFFGSVLCFDETLGERKRDAG
jgi:hypothetical protein